MPPTNLAQQRADRQRPRRKSDSRSPQTLTNSSQGPRPSSSGSMLRSVFVGRQHQTKKPSKLSEAQILVPEGSSKTTMERSRAPSQPQNSQQSLRAGPLYTEAPKKSEGREAAKRSSQTTASQAIVLAASSARLSPLQQSSSWFTARLFWKRKPVDVLKELKVDIRVAAEKIESQTWCASLKNHTSTLSLGEMIKSNTLSPETRDLLKGGLEEFREYKKQEDEKQQQEEKEKKDLIEAGKALEVVDSKIVQKGPVFHRVERLVPAHSMRSLRTLDPRVQKTPSVGSNSTHTSRTRNRATKTEPERPTTSGLVMQRSRGVARRPSVEALIRSGTARPRTSADHETASETKRQDSPQLGSPAP